MQGITLHVLYTPPHRALLLWLADALRLQARRAVVRFQQGQRRRAERATLRTLHALDDHLLHDLGIDRSELLSIVGNPGDPTRRRT